MYKWLPNHLAFSVLSCPLIELMPSCKVKPTRYIGRSADHIVTANANGRPWALFKPTVGLGGYLSSAVNSAISSGMVVVGLASSGSLNLRPIQDIGGTPA